MIGLCKGAHATLVIPADEGYGDIGAGTKIAGGATLNYDIEVVDIDDESLGEERNYFSKIDTDANGVLSEEEVKIYFKATHGQDMPGDLMEHEDTDKDGSISWEEFNGPKGDRAPNATQ